MKTMVLTGLVLVAGIASAQQSPHGELSMPCQECHTTSSWAMRPDTKFSHASTGFALVGQHRFLECRSCHEGLKFAGTEKNCLSCHTDVHNSELGSDCLRCHIMTSWAVTDMRQKHQQTRFPLVGRHLDADCESCHSAEAPRRFASTSPECISCHRADYTATMEPSHAVEGFPIECSDCHKVTAPAWRGSFDHDLTAFPLRGAHAAVICSQCHAGNRFGKLPTDCYSCHQSDFTAAASPDHVAGGYSHDCLSCHTVEAWSPASFDHSVTVFPLTGKHAATACRDCHVNGNYQLTFTDCYQCHQSEYASVTNPNHVANAYDHNCATCHSTSGWGGASFNHNATAFPLTGSHTSITCATCHVNNNYQLTYTDCYACHQSEYVAATDPDHATANFGHDCTACHTTSVWTPSTFDHDGRYFRINSGRHLGQWTSCADCHDAPSDYAVFTCISCHVHSQAEADGHHGSVGDYVYTRTSCFTCHPDA